jgi:hypothetical protein
VVEVVEVVDVVVDVVVVVVGVAFVVTETLALAGESRYVDPFPIAVTEIL